MSSKKRGIRGVVLAEDKRTECFFRKLLEVLGFQPRKFTFRTSPQGEGSAEAWVRKNYPGEVRNLRAKNYQAGLILIAARDDDGVGLEERKQQLEDALCRAGLEPRQQGEKIATPVPARNIETWLLSLLGEAELEERSDYKHRYEKGYASDERSNLAKAARAWEKLDDRVLLPSLRDGAVEFENIEP